MQLELICFYNRTAGARCFYYMISEEKKVCFSHSTLEFFPQESSDKFQNPEN